jgi:hypothetical protein
MLDVGMSSHYVAEADALATLALAVNRSADAASLSLRAKTMRAAIAASLWDDSRGTFANRFLNGNGSLSRRISPTSFYALGARAATDAQAARMAEEWAFNASRFCLSREWPPPPPSSSPAAAAAAVATAAGPDQRKTRGNDDDDDDNDDAAAAAAGTAAGAAAALSQATRGNDGGRDNGGDDDDDECFWGLPSISADDPAFPPLGYWRGYAHL